MLVYEKAKKEPLSIVCKEEDVKLIKSQPRAVIDKLSQKLQTKQTENEEKGEPLSCDGTAMSRDNNEIKTDGEASDLTMIDTSARSSATMKTESAQKSAAGSDTEMILSTAESTARKSDNKVSVEDDKAVDELMVKLPHSYLIYPSLVQKLFEKEIEDSEEMKGEDKEHIVEVPFHNVQSFVPNNYYRQVHQDN